MATHDESGTMRVDKWLWAARFFKTRAIAADAVDGGKVHVNGERVKRAKSVRVGDEIQLRLGPYEHRVVVRELSERRGPATVAATLYEEHAESVAERERLQAQRRLEATRVMHDAGRPNKRERRQIDELRRRHD
jgi:ribosome-associated heat shock protein Hsp15